MEEVYQSSRSGRPTDGYGESFYLSHLRSHAGALMCIRYTCIGGDDDQ